MAMKKIVKRIIWCVVGILATPVVLYFALEGLDSVAPEFTEEKIMPVVANLFTDYDDFIEWHQEDVEPLFEKVEEYINKIKTMVE